MTSARKLAPAAALASALAAGSIGIAHAQLAPWPTNAPQTGTGTQPPWPTNAPPGGQATAPGAGGGMPPQGQPTETQQKCLQDFTRYRGEVEKRAMAAKATSEKKPTREEMCKVVTAYAAAEAKWIKFSEENVARCGIPPQAIDQIKAVHVRTSDARKKLCAPGPAQAAGSTGPSLSDALGTSTLPTEETKKRPSGGTLDTLTGNALGR